MNFISSIIFLNVFIILMMIIAFSNITFVYQIQSLELYQLANLNNPDYETYLLQPMAQYEKKLNIQEYFSSIHNLYFIKFKLSGEKTWRERLQNIEQSCMTYTTAEYAVEEYYINKFYNAILALTECCKVHTRVDEGSGNVSSAGNQLQNILDAVYSTLHNNYDADDSSGCGGCLNLESKFKKNSEINLEKVIGAVDAALDSVPRKKQFYHCFQYFKNAVFYMKLENAKYPIKASNINVMDKTKDLNMTEKKKILTVKDIEFIYQIHNNMENFDKQWLQDYTGYIVSRTINNGYDVCWNLLRNNYSETTFRITELSYQFIYPSQSENLPSYKSKRQIIIKNLKYHLNTDNGIKQRFTTLEDGNGQVDQKYYEMMKKCRALSGEIDYEVYVMRLINNGCRPLGELEWGKELKVTGRNNAAAKLQGSGTK